MDTKATSSPDKSQHMNIKINLAVRKIVLILQLFFLCATCLAIASPCEEELNSFRYTEALDCMKAEVIGGSDNHSELYFSIGMVYLELMQPNQALEWVNKAEASVDKEINLGHIYFFLENFKIAEKHYKNVLNSLESQVWHRTIANYVISNIYSRRITELYDGRGVWQWSVPKGVNTLEVEVKYYYQQFLSSFEIQSKTKDQLVHKMPIITQLECKYVPNVNLEELQGRLEIVVNNTPDSTLNTAFGMQQLASIIGVRYTNSLTESKQVFGPDTENYWRDNKNLITPFIHRFGNRSFYTKGNEYQNAALSIYQKNSPQLEALAHLNFADWNLKVIAGFTPILNQMSNGTDPEIKYHLKSSAAMQKYNLKALEASHAALKLVYIEFNQEDLGKTPDLSNVSYKDLESQVISIPLFKNALVSKANVLFHAASYTTARPEDTAALYFTSFQAAYETINTMDEFIDKLSQTIEKDNDKFFYASKVKDDRLFAIDFSMLRFGIQPRDKMLNSGLFKMLIQTNGTEALAEAYEKERNDAFTKPGDYIKPILNGYRLDKSEDSTFLHLAFYFAEKTKAHSLLTSITESRSNAEYSNQQIELKGLSQVQESLDDETALMEFVFTDDYLYRFDITNKYLRVVRLRRKTEEGVSKEVKAIRNGILYYQDKTYAENAFSLYKKLFPEFDKEIKNLIIIPDGLMYLVPFEALLTKKVPKKRLANHAEYPYLLKRFNISYAFSGSLFLIDRDENKGQAEKEGFLGLAPVFSDDVLNNKASVRGFDSLINDRKRSILKNGTYVSPLPGTETEVNAIARTLREGNVSAKIIMGQEATEEAIKSEDLNKYKYLHIATHGFVNTEDPDQSGLMFYPDDTSDEDGILYGPEIYNMSIGADLVTLSACETGMGKVISGEGLIGLTRALQFAGAKNQLVSMWKVSDKSTSQLMRNFYGYLIENPSANYSESLTFVKRQMVSSGDYAHPYFWSPFILIGQ